MDNNNNKSPKPSGLINGFVLIAVAVLLIFMTNMLMNQPAVSDQRYSTILSYFDEEKVDEFTLDFGTGELIMYLKEGETKKEDKFPSTEESSSSENAESSAPAEVLANQGGIFQNLFGGWAEAPEEKREIISFQIPNVGVFLDNIEEVVREHNIKNPDEKIKYDYIKAKEQSLFIQMLPQLLLTGVIMIPLFMMMRNVGGVGGGGKTGGLFGKTKGVHRIEKSDVMFADVAGADEEKDELVEVVDFLKNPKKYNSLGARIPKGVLLVGPPGTGKTLLAKAVAGEANVPFFSLAGSDFVEMFVGLGASRVRELFEEAKKEAPSIIFIDEIDAVGRQRGTGASGGSDEREQTLNQLLVEMDGFKTDENVIVISATNRLDILDKALLRAGRFDRQVTVNYPDVKGREDILKVHTKNKPLGPDVDLATIAKTTVGFTGADLENLINEAALAAAKAGKKAITMHEVQESVMKVVVGLEKRSKIVSEKEKRSTCYHEAGHAVSGYYLDSQDPVHEVSIIPRGPAGGYTMSLPTEDRLYKLRGEMFDDMVMSLGGLMAEKLIFGDISTGVSGDLRSVDKTAREMIRNYGFSDILGTVAYVDDPDGMPGTKFSEKTKALIDDEVRNLSKKAYDRCEEILTKHIDKLRKIAKYLFEFEKIDGPTFKRLMEEDEDYSGVIIEADGSFIIASDIGKPPLLGTTQTDSADIFGGSSSPDPKTT